jgi:hypothetical protein
MLAGEYAQKPACAARFEPLYFPSPVVDNLGA